MPSSVMTSRGILFGIGVLGAIDMEWMWDQIVEICKKNKCIAGGDTNCSEANTAMFMAGGMTSKDVPHVYCGLVPGHCRLQNAGGL